MKILNLKNIIVTSIILMTMMFVALLALLSATIHTTVVRDDLGDDLPALVREVAELESAYLEKRSEVTLATVGSTELVENNDIEYVTRRRAVTFASSLD